MCVKASKTHRVDILNSAASALDFSEVDAVIVVEGSHELGCASVCWKDSEFFGHVKE